MKLKKEYIILAAVIIALSAYLLTRQTDRTHYELPQVGSIKSNEITRIELSGPEGTVNLTKADDAWSVGTKKYRADKAKISPMIDTISDLNLTALVSEAKDYTRYDLADEKKILVKAWIGAEIKREFDIGKAAPSFRHTFIRLAGDPNVYQASDNFRSKFEYSEEDVRDKVVLSFAASDVSEINLTSGKETLSLLRKEVPLEEPAEPGQDDVNQDENKKAEAAPIKGKMTWLTSDGRSADASTIDQLVASLSQLSCDTYLADKNKTEFTDPIYILKIIGQKTYTLEIFDKENDSDLSFPAASSESDEPFSLTESNAKRLMPQFEDIIEKPVEEKEESSSEKKDSDTPQDK
jgi:hypothetical protein